MVATKQNINIIILDKVDIQMTQQGGERWGKGEGKTAHFIIARQEAVSIELCLSLI